MREIKHSINTYGIEEENEKTIIYYEDGEIKLSLPAVGLSDEIILIILNVYDTAWNAGEEMGQWRARQAIRKVLGL